jgi:hypothetical protein
MDHMMLGPLDVKWAKTPPSVPAGAEASVPYGDPGGITPGATLRMIFLGRPLTVHPLVLLGKSAPSGLNFFLWPFHGWVSCLRRTLLGPRLLSVGRSPHATTYGGRTLDP